MAATVENLAAFCALLINEDEMIIQCILEALECALEAGLGQMVKEAIEGVGGTSGLIVGGCRGFEFCVTLYSRTPLIQTPELQTPL